MLPRSCTALELEGTPARSIKVTSPTVPAQIWSQFLPVTVAQCTCPISRRSKARPTSRLVHLLAGDAVKIDEFEYNEFRVAQLSPRYYTHNATAVLTARR